MKRFLVVLLAGFLFMVFTSHDSYANPFGRPGDMEKSFCGEDMHMIPPLMDHPGRERIEDMLGHPFCRHLADLGLDTQQKEAIKDIRSRVIKETIRNKADEQIAGIELKELLDKDTVDLKAAEMKLKQIETFRTAAHLSFIRALEEVKAKLNPDQMRKFRDMIEDGPDMGLPPPVMGDMMHRKVKMPPPPCLKEDGILDGDMHIPDEAK